MTKLIICFPGGAGGNWLDHLIYSLEINNFKTTNKVNYHNHKKTASVKMTHDVSDKSVVFFNSNNLFNVYLNVVKKYRFNDLNILDNCSIRECFEILASEASSKLFFLEERTDLSWDDIFLNPDKFVQDLYNVLDQYNIVYTKNNDICRAAIDEYKSTCVDPREHFDNFNSVYWLGWCNGVCKHLWRDWPLVDSVEQMRDFLLPRQDFFRDYTKQYMLEFQ